MEDYIITIREIREVKIPVTAESREAAIAKLEEEYWKNPLEYDPILEPNDTIFE